MKELQKAIKRLHGCDSQHVETVPVKETYQGQTLWDGEVEVFRLKGHPKANLCYAWSFDQGDGRTQHVAVLGIPPVENAATAVKVYLSSLAK
jgi:hypothetical protein